MSGGPLTEGARKALPGREGSSARYGDHALSPGALDASLSSWSEKMRGSTVGLGTRLCVVQKAMSSLTLRPSTDSPRLSSIMRRFIAVRVVSASGHGRLRTTSPASKVPSSDVARVRSHTPSPATQAPLARPPPPPRDDVHATRDSTASAPPSMTPMLQ